MSDDLRAFPDRLNLFRRDRKMTMGDHLCYDPSDWHSYVRADLFEELEAEVARLRDVQADADEIRKAALKSAFAALNQVPLFGETPQDMHVALQQYIRSRDAIFALIDNTGKEVMPDEPRTSRPAHDTGPGDQAVAGAAQKGDAP